MAATITIEKTSDWEFLVRVSDPDGNSTHRVMVEKEDYARLTGGKIQPEELVKRSFEFLLQHEPKESILARFDLSVIGRYFPEYEREIQRKAAN